MLCVSNKVLIPNLALAAAAKLWGTEEFWTILDQAVQLRGGRGYETETSLNARGEFGYPLERVMRDIRVNRILEGSTEIMHLFLAREALDPHFSKAGPLLKRGSFAKKFKALLQCAWFYPLWYLGLVGGYFRSFFKLFSGFDTKIKPHLRWVDRTSKKLAMALFHQMVLKGPKLEFKQLILARVVDIGVELSIMGLVASRMQTDRNNNHPDAAKNYEIGLYWLKTRKKLINRLLADLSSKSDDQAMALSKQLLDGAGTLPEPSFDHLTPMKRRYGKDLTNIQAKGKSEDSVSL